MEYWICMLLAKYLLQTLCSLQSANSVFFSHQISTSHQLTASQHCFSLTTNQHQPPAKANRTKLLQKKIKERAEHDTIYLRMIRL